MDYKIIVIDDDLDFLEILKGHLLKSGFKNIRTEDNPLNVASLFEKGEDFDIALIDMTMPGIDGLDLLEIIKNINPRTECIMVTAVNEARIAVECLKKGAYDYLLKPVSQEDLIFSMKRVLEKKRLLDILDIGKSPALPRLKNAEPFKPILTRSPKVLRILKEAELHAGSDVPLLITGGPFMPPAPDLVSPLHRSTWHRSPVACSKRNFSVTPREHLQVLKTAGGVIWNIAIAEPYFWMKSATWHLNFRVSCCDFYRMENTLSWEQATSKKQMFDSSQPPTRIWKNLWPKRLFAKIYITVSGVDGFICRL
jgi:CheY-like chemotaxis protein